MSDLKKYCLPYLEFARYLGTAIVCEIFLFIFAASKYLLFVLIFIVVLNLLVYWLFMVDEKSAFDRRVSSLGARGVLNTVLMDFTQGNMMFGGNLIIGEYSMIGKRKGMLLCFDELQAIRAGHIRENKRRRNCIYVTVENKEYMLCITYAGTDAFQREYDDLCRYIYSKNPYVKFV